MRTNIIALFCLLALRVYGFEEILPTQTLELESRAESSCNQYHAEARVNNRRVGYLSFNTEGYASVTRDKHAAAVLHTDSDGRPRAGKSFIGAKSSKRKYSTLKADLHKKKAASGMPSNLCYSSKTKMVYSGSVPQRLQCSPVTITPSCVKHQHKPNPSDGAYPPQYGRRDENAKRSIPHNPAWEAMRAAL